MSTQLSKEQLKALEDKVAVGKELRAAKLKALVDVASIRRLENEALLVDIEASRGLTVGIDLGVVWCPNGEMVAVSKPDLLSYEKFQVEALEASVKDKAKVRDEFVKPYVVHPTTARELDSLCEVYGDVMFTAANLMSHMHDIDKDKTEGKS